MNKSSITVSETEGKETAESGTWQLPVVVAVLGTLVGMVVMVGGMWVCMVCSKRKGHYGRRDRRGQESAFSTLQREMVELGHIPVSPSHLPDLPPDVNNNCSGISRGLGLGVSYPVEQNPCLPTPRSWTPSPPFNPQQRLHGPQPESWASLVATGGTSEGRQEPGRTLYGSRAGTSPYNPRYNSPATDYYYRTPSIHTQSYSCRTLEVDPEPRRNNRTHEQGETLIDPHYRKPSRSPARKACRRLTMRRRHRTNEEPDEDGGRRYQNPRIILQDPSENMVNLLRGETCSEAPAACSSCHDTPHLPHHHHHPVISRSGRRYLNPSRASLLDDFNSDPMQEREDHSPATRHKRSARPRVKRKENGKTLPSPPASPTTRPHWMKHYQSGVGDERRGLYSCCLQTSTDNGLWLLRPRPSITLPTSPHSQQDPRAEHDRIVAKRLALKYGFCTACGVQKSLKQRLRIPGYAPYGRQQKSRSTQTEWDDLNSSMNNNHDLTQDLTPSMSWDNLTLDPSPVLTNTLEGTRVLEAAASVAVHGGCVDDEAHDDVGSHVGAREDRLSAGATACGIIYTGEDSWSSGE